MTPTRRHRDALLGALTLARYSPPERRTRHLVAPLAELLAWVEALIPPTTDEPA